LGRGFLSGNFKSDEEIPLNDYRRNHPRFQKGNIEQNYKIVEQLKEIAKEKTCSTVQLALAWVLHQGDGIVPIPGTKKVKYLEENAKAVEIKLSADELEKISAIAPFGITKGLRYAERAMKAVNR
jgi:aryl-alcohol dehydrogenase-like predicted oxidoreductase